MAINWKVGEAVRAIKEGNKEAILDIGKRFPLFAVLAAQSAESSIELFEAIPDYITARQIESRLKGETDGDDKAPDEKADTKADDKPAAGKGKYDEMTPKEVYQLVVKREIEFDPEKKKDKEYMIKQLKKADKAAADAAAKAAKEKAKDKDDKDDWDDDKADSAKDTGKAKDKPKDDDDWDV